MPTINAIVAAKLANGTYKETPDGLTGGCDDRGEWETKNYLVPWSERSRFITEFKGISYQSGGIGGTWVQGAPYQLPDNGKLYVRDITFTPEGEMIRGSSPIAFSHARMNVTFRQAEYNYQPADDPGFLNSLSQDAEENAALLYATQELDFGKEWMSIPNSSVKFLSDNAVASNSISRALSVITMNITWHRYPVIPMTLLRTYTDTLNDQNFLGCQKGTVYFDGAKTVREASESATGTTITQRVQFTFRWRLFDWNQFLRPDTLAFDTVVNKTYAGGPGGDYSNSATYRYKDFSKLLLTQ